MKTLILSALVLGSSAFASEGFEITNSCNDSMVCASVTGPYSEGRARTAGKKYFAQAEDSTCCQLAATIQSEVCRDGHDSKGVQVWCD